MDKNPFTFNSANRRIVDGVERDNRLYFAASGIWFYSLYAYNRKYLRKNGDILGFMAFAALSVPAAYAYADLAFGSAETEAALQNN